MKLTFPHLGNIDIILGDLFTRLGVEVVVPPKTSLRTINFGVKYSPELACFPLKVTVGNLIEGLEAGADLAVMVGGVGPCRFGLYAEVQKRILESLGKDFEMVIIKPPQAGYGDFLAACAKLVPKRSFLEIARQVKIAWAKAVVMDELEREVLKMRCFERFSGATDLAHIKAVQLIRKANSRTELEALRKEALRLLSLVEKEETEGFLKIGLVGEFYVVLEPFVNFDIEKMLGQKGIYVERSVYLTDWLDPLKRNRILGTSRSEIAHLAQPYLSHFVGGEGQATVGHVVEFAREGFDGVIQLLPFTCMPEIIAKSVLGKVVREMDVPILTLSIDEQTGRAGIMTRLEAFTDLLKNRRLERRVV